MEDQSLETHLSSINKIAGNLARIFISTSPGSSGMTTATGIKLGLKRALLLRFIIFFRKPFTAAIQKDNPTALIFFFSCESTQGSRHVLYTKTRTDHRKELYYFHFLWNLFWVKISYLRDNSKSTRFIVQHLKTHL